MKKIYLVFSYTGSFPSKIIKFYTKNTYSHVSIALDKSLNKMYSFSRINPYIFIVGGFVHEKINDGTFKRFKKTKSLICSLDVTNFQYQKIVEIINNFEKDSNRYKYNLIGCLIIPLHIKFQRENHFYCAEFIKYLFEETKIDYGLPNLIKPADLLNIKSKEIVYDGLLNNYK
jgi:hypothetical protein